MALENFTHANPDIAVALKLTDDSSFSNTTDVYLAPGKIFTKLIFIYLLLVLKLILGQNPEAIPFDPNNSNATTSNTKRKEFVQLNTDVLMQAQQSDEKQQQQPEEERLWKEVEDSVCEIQIFSRDFLKSTEKRFVKTGTTTSA